MVTDRPPVPDGDADESGVDRLAPGPAEEQALSVGLREHLPGRLLDGSLPLEGRPDGHGGTSAAPVAMFAPVHLVASRPVAPGPASIPHVVASENLPSSTASQPVVGAPPSGPATGDGQPPAAGEADPVGSRVSELLADAGTATLTTVEPADATYDFDEYGLLAAGDADGMGRGLFPSATQQTMLSLKVHGRHGRRGHQVARG